MHITNCYPFPPAPFAHTLSSLSRLRPVTTTTAHCIPALGSQHILQRDYTHTHHSPPCHTPIQREHCVDASSHPHLSWTSRTASASQTLWQITLVPDAQAQPGHPRLEDSNLANGLRCIWQRGPQAQRLAMKYVHIYLNIFVLLTWCRRCMAAGTSLAGENADLLRRSDSDSDLAHEAGRLQAGFTQLKVRHLPLMLRTLA